MLIPLLFALAVDGSAALEHASRLAALGPHPWGSPRTRVAAQYVAGELRAVGLQEVQLQEFESRGVRGANVIGVLRAPGEEFVVLSAHHDTAPGSPGAYDGGGVGVLIEVARAFVSRAARPRTVAFVSFDGGEVGSAGLPDATGARAYVRSLGPRARHMVAALAIEEGGYGKGRPLLHPIAYPDPRRPGAPVIAPGWLVREVQAGAARAGGRLGIGDPWLSGLYQPAVRVFRVGFGGDDLAFVEARLPAVLVSDSSPTSFYPWYRKPADTPDKLDPGALSRMGEAVAGALEALQSAEPGPAVQPTWYTVGGLQVEGATVIALVLLSLVPGLWLGLVRGGALLVGRLLAAAGIGVLAWRHPVPSLWIYPLPALLTLACFRWWRTLIALTPAAALLLLGAAAQRQDVVHGTWLLPWEVVVAMLGLSLLWLRPPAPAAPRGRRRRK
jgi:hypothetical protein